VKTFIRGFWKRGQKGLMVLKFLRSRFPSYFRCYSRLGLIYRAPLNFFQCLTLNLGVGALPEKGLPLWDFISGTLLGSGFSRYGARKGLGLGPWVFPKGGWYRLGIPLSLGPLGPFAAIFRRVIWGEQGLHQKRGASKILS